MCFKELSKITMPVVFNEPLTFLQRITEYLEYATLLETAAAQEDPVDRMMVWLTYLLFYHKYNTVESVPDIPVNHQITKYTVMTLSFRTDMPGQTVQTQIRLLLKEQSDQGLHCLPFRLHCLDSLLYGRAT